MADLASKLPVRTETDGDVVVKITDGTRTAGVKETGAVDSLQVAVVDASGNQITSFAAGAEALTTGEINAYDTSAAVAPAGSANHDYTITTAKTLRFKGFHAAGSGKIKVELKVGPVGTLVSKGVWFNSTAEPNIDVTFPQPIEVPDTSTGTVRLIRTNLDTGAQDVYSTIFGIEL